MLTQFCIVACVIAGFVSALAFGAMAQDAAVGKDADLKSAEEERTDAYAAQPTWKAACNS